MEISGVVGLTLLKKNNEYMVCFYDDHSNKKYCSNKLYFISDLLLLLNNKIKNVKFFIEDYKENNEKYFIWNKNTSKHLLELNNLIKYFKNNDDWNFTDIRLYIQNDIENLNILFDLSKTNDKKLFELKLIIDLGKKLNNNLKNIYENLKNKFLLLKKNFNKTEIIEYYYDYFYKSYFMNNKIFKNKEYELEQLIDGIMEYYTLVLITLNKSNLNILNYGLLHTVNLVYYFKKNGYETIYKNGITEEDFNDKFNLYNLENELTSCINLDINKINF